jgi:hypothetical protein
MESLFESNENRFYGWFCYEGAMCDKAFSLDRSDMIQECIDRGWIVPESRTIDERSMVWHARRNGKMRVAKTLIENGWKDEPNCSIGAGRFA